MKGDCIGAEFTMPTVSDASRSPCFTSVAVSSEDDAMCTAALLDSDDWIIPISLQRRDQRCL